MTTTIDVPRPKAHCKTCQAPVFWATFSGSGKRAPIDYDPADNGNVVIIGRGTQGEPLVSAVRQVEQALFATEPQYLNHWATCTNPPPRRKGSR